MSLATIENVISPREIVLLKAFDERGFVFYTNHEGRKGRQLLSTPKASAVLLLVTARYPGSNRGNGTKVRMKRQMPTSPLASASVRLEPGPRVRARRSRLAILDERVAKYEKEFEGREVARPPFWSGFRVRRKDRVLEGQAKSSP